VQIPLDYYRILGVPIQATDEQLQQAYGDRSSQLPRREYGEFAIASRKLLLDQAYQILADSEKRLAYDADFLEKNSALLEEKPVEQKNQGIEIPNEQLVGGLLILQELGEYELVIRLGENYLNQISDAEKKQAQRQDLILTLTSAYLELSREKWEQQDYEAAATIAQKGLNLLNRENLFPQLQEEISAEYYKLRPYRILNFLSSELEQKKIRSQGLQLLQEMLQERQGIDGSGNDGSGLNPNRFLLYIQQLRPYLTVNEQLAIFNVSRSSSAVDACLNVYILIAKGFCDQQPEFILQATSLLEQLSKYQDVYLEQAICALLLCQTEKADLAVEKTQETAALTYIREHSQDSPDLLPGLYQYTEKWLQTEVYPQFRDLMTQQVSLKDYFSDESVQNYLEKVSNLTELEIMSSKDNNILDQSKVSVDSEVENDNLIPLTGELAMRKSALSYSQYLPEPNFPQRPRGKKTAVSSATRTTQRAGENSVGYRGNNVVFSPTYPQPEPSRYPRKNTSTKEKADSLIQNKPALKKKTRTKRRKFRLAKPLLMGLGLLGVIGLSVFALKAIQESRSPLAALQGEQLDISLNQPPLELPLANAQVVLSGTLTPEGAKQVIQTWLEHKTQAFGAEHHVEQLKNILAEPLLSDWQKRAIALKEQKNFWQYQHQLEIESVTTNVQNRDRASVAAKVREKAQYNQNGKIVASNSYDQDLLVRYELVRQQEQWLIQDIKVSKSF
jgi:curved DNA-binding protein CbpA